MRVPGSGDERTFEVSKVGGLDLVELLSRVGTVTVREPHRHIGKPEGRVPNAFGRWPERHPISDACVHPIGRAPERLPKLAP